MTKKQHRLAIEDNLSKALEPPRKKTPPPALNEILSQYTPPASMEAPSPATVAAPVILDTPSVVDSPATMDRPVAVDSPTIGHPVGRPMDSPATEDSPATVDDPLSYLPNVKGHTELPHRFTDHLCRVLSPDEQSIFTQLYRLSWGWGKDTCLVSNPRLSERANVPETTLRRVVRKLETKKLVKVLDRLFGGKEQGILYRVSRLDGLSTVDSPATVAPNKVKDLKEHIKEEAPPGYCNKCKDTGGFLYPKGIGNGPVKKCKHEP